VLASDAVFANDEKQIYVRVASCDGAIYVDLANSSWEAVRITADGWEIVPHTPVIFWRPPGMQALPRPERGGAITELRQFLNLENEDQWILYVGWLLGALQPKGPFPLLILQGVHGSAKSTNTRVLRSLLDPNEAAIRSEPGTTRDLMISAKNSRCLAFDNLSFLSSSLCDALCRLSTGGGFSTRALYTDDGEKIFQGTRPVILNGIDLGIERADLLDRAICVWPPLIGEGARETEAQFWARFEVVCPRILGNLFDIVSCTLRRLPGVRPCKLPRMADFATAVSAAEPALGWRQGTFLEAYARNRESTSALALEASPLVQPILRIAEHGCWQGTATELLGQLIAEQLNDQIGMTRAYPRSPRQLSQELRRLVPNLRQLGINVEFSRAPGPNSERVITIFKAGDARDAATQPA